MDLEQNKFFCLRCPTEEYVQLKPCCSARGSQCGAVTAGVKLLNVDDSYVGKSLVVLNITKFLLLLHPFALISMFIFPPVPQSCQS